MRSLSNKGFDKYYPRISIWDIFFVFFSGQASLKVNYGQLRRAKSPAVKNPRPSYLWACTVFLSASAQSTLLLFFSVTLFAKGKKDVCTPTTTTVLHLRQKKITQSYVYITCSYIRALAWRQINRAKYNLIMYNSRTKSTLCPATLPERPTIFPSSLSMVAVRKNRSSFISVCLR